jgi:hypothetical protein
MKLILIGVILITLFTNTTMAKNKKNINWRQIMTSDEAYTYTPPQKKKKSIWDKIIYGIGDSNPKWKKPIKLFSKGGKVK